MNVKIEQFRQFLNGNHIFNEFQSDFEVVIYPRTPDEKRSVYYFIRRNLADEQPPNIKYDYISLQIEPYDNYCRVIRELRKLAADNQTLLVEKSNTSFMLYFKTDMTKQILQHAVRKYYDRKFFVDPEKEKDSLLHIELKKIYPDGTALDEAGFKEIKKSLVQIAELCHSKFSQEGVSEYNFVVANRTVWEILTHQLQRYRDIKICDSYGKSHVLTFNVRIKETK